MRHVVSLLAGGVLSVTSPSVSAAYLSPISFIDQPGLVLMVDGKDRDSLVRIKLKLVGNSTGLDFGFMSGDSYSSLAGHCCSKSAIAAFSGGVLVDFAVRSAGADEWFGTADDQIFQLSNAAGYVDLYHSGRNAPPKSRRPRVPDPYYSRLAMIWDLDRDGIADLGVTMNSRGSFDGMQFSPAPVPVPLPAAAWLLGSGLTGLAVISRKRRVRR